MIETSVQFKCAFCGAKNLIQVDPTAGMSQEFIEDCQVCCRPIKVKVRFDEANMQPTAEAEFEG